LTLQAAILGKVSIESVIYSDGWRGYNGLVDVGYSKHFRVSHGDNEFARDGHCHINGIESFWSFTKRRLAKFNGVSVNFELHLKESEWRWKKYHDELAAVNYGNSSDFINLSASLEPKKIPCSVKRYFLN
jgi:transposase